MISLPHNIHIDEDQYQLSAIRSAGNGGQNVNKVATAIHLRFDIAQSTLPEKYKARLLVLSDSRINKEGIVVIKAQSHRTQEKNKDDAIARLKALIASVLVEKKPRRATRPSLNAKKKRVDAKKRNGMNKALRKKVDF
ncbi:aminoacyl-tRNA hydrolase [Glaciecola sp. XM2]|uniref:alternative ribosome rescue aminoacyl-tRNA hydrolase ArfB n=1 Tax=Glaciecola sp. XM2 TaxID=1914931 RepID=UPI001BDF05D7|nr:aminoacyl-tRNA hydrolase [Glaciecola sp. XM2]